MEYFIKCVIYLGILGIVSHIVGEAIPRKWMDPGKFPFVCREWERDGKIYDGLNIRAWKDHLPDMSRVMKKMVPKKIVAGMGETELIRLIQETCIAELIHQMLILFSLFCINIWPGRGGAVVALLFSAGNVPFILIQRYNRPKLIRLLKMLRKRRNKTGCEESPRCVCESAV